MPAETQPRINPPAELPAALSEWPALSGRHPEVPDDYELVSESDVLRLYLRRDTSALIVEDKRSGQLWRSSPSDLDDNPEVGAAWRKRIQYPLWINYVGEDRARDKIAKPEELE